MRRFSFSILLSIGLVLISGNAFTQTNWPTTWPGNPPVGIGTQLCLPISGPQNALQINYDTATVPTPSPTLEAIIRLSNANGSGTPSNTFGILGLMSPHLDAAYSTLSKAQDLILHHNQGGDIIITNYWPANALANKAGGSIRLATAGDTSAGHQPADTTLWHKDYQRVLITADGKIGFNLPKDSIPMDQIQIGGGTVAPPGYTSPWPGLTMFGGDEYEGMMIRGTGIYPVDWRGISFNMYKDHTSGYASRFEPMASAGIGFGPDPGGLLNFSCYPYNISLGMTDFSKRLTLQLTGNEGLQLWFMDTSVDPYHHLLDIRVPGDTAGGVRNTNGLSVFYTPLCITPGYGGDGPLNFTNFPYARPTLGDDSTWMLVVNGAALFKETYVSLKWPDFVFDPSYDLTPLHELKEFITENHHLPGVPSAKEMDSTGVPLGRTEAAMMQKIEELTLYTIDLNKKIESLESKLDDLEKQGGK